MFLGRKDLGRIDDINTILTADGDALRGKAETNVMLLTSIV